LNAGPDVSHLKELATSAIRAERNRILALADDVWRTPELGFKEHKTAERVSRFLSELGLTVRTGLALTGVKAVAEGRSKSGSSPGRPCVGVLGELDAVICRAHPDADPLTGAVHACGHHAQLAVMAGAAVGLTSPGVLNHLSGSVAFMATPAEEYVEITYRLELRRKGAIEFLGGKPELIRLGEFDDVDMVILVHAGGAGGTVMSVGGSANAFAAKSVRYAGQEAHAGASPWLGLNALNSATLAISAINALRETFNEEDCIRVHPIITKGGDLVNIVPADVRLETYVRARSLQAVLDTSAKVDRAFKAGALAMGTVVEIQDLPGYLPMTTEPKLARLFRRNMIMVAGVEHVREGGHMSASTDMGDMAQVMPALHPHAAGVVGHPHSSDFRVVDPDRAYIMPAEAVAMTVIDLLADGARKAVSIRDNYRAAMTRAEYVEYARSMFRRTVFPEEGLGRMTSDGD